MDKSAVLAHHHLAIAVGDKWKLIMLFADARRHGGAKQYCVHLESRTSECILDDIEVDWIDIDGRKRGLIGLYDRRGHVVAPSTRP